MKYSLNILFPLISFISFKIHCQNSLPKSGKWNFELIANDSITIPFFLNIEKDEEFHFTVLNGEEKIQIKNYTFHNDSLQIELPVFNSEIKLQILDSYNMIGKWFNYAKGKNYEIPITGTLSNEKRFQLETKKKQTDFSGKYEVIFSPSNDPYKALGIFNQNGDQITGTFLTETGDFRFLEGNVSGDKMYLSCFDGSHAFYFSANSMKDSIHGYFYSGKHYQTEWIAKKNENYSLKNPDSITYSTNNSEITFSLPDLDSTIFNFPNDSFKDKVTIIQIMGSWCPNCMDETKFYQDLYEQYHDQGLEIIAVAFETPKDFQSKKRILKKLKNHFGIEYKLLIGGNASKKIASKIFPNLNSIVSFPTSIFIDKQNKVRKIHTGFNGPGTNKYYKEYVLKTNTFIQKLLSE